MRLLRPGLGREAEADDRAAGDHGRPVRDRPGGDDRRADRVRVVTVDLKHVPAGGTEPLDLVVRHGEAGRPVDRDRIIVPERDQPPQLQVARQRDRLLADALHQAAIAQKDVGIVVDQLVAELGVHDPLGQRHADQLRHALAQRAGGQLDPVRVMVFGVARRLAADLAEALQLLDRHVLVAGEVEQAVQQHRPVAVRQDEAIPVDPVRLRRIELHEVLEQDGRDIRHSHRRAGVAALGALHGIHGEEADAVRHVAQGLVPRGRNGLRRGLIGAGFSHETSFAAAGSGLGRLKTVATEDRIGPRHTFSVDAW